LLKLYQQTEPAEVQQLANQIKFGSSLLLHSVSLAHNKLQIASKCVKFCGLHLYVSRALSSSPVFITQKCSQLSLGVFSRLGPLACEIKLKFELKFKAEILDACIFLLASALYIAVYTRALAVRKYKQTCQLFLGIWIQADVGSVERSTLPHTRLIRPCTYEPGH
jgi:hypothetical protein